MSSVVASSYILYTDNYDNLHQAYSLLSQFLSGFTDSPGDLVQVLVDNLVDDHLNPLSESPGPLLCGGVALHGMLVSSLRNTTTFKRRDLLQRVVQYMCDVTCNTMQYVCYLT